MNRIFIAWFSIFLSAFSTYGSVLTEAVPVLRGLKRTSVPISRFFSSSFPILSPNDDGPVLPLRQNRPIQPDRRTVRILSIDGGGIRGIIPLHVLQQLETRDGTEIRTPIAHQFDIIAGSSTGGIISLGLNLRKEPGSIDPAYGANELISMYARDCQNIFDFRKNNRDESGRHTIYKQFLGLLTPENRKTYYAKMDHIEKFLRNPGLLGLFVPFILNRLGLSNALEDVQKIKKVLSREDLDTILTEISQRRNILESSHSENGLKYLKEKFTYPGQESSLEPRLSESLSTVLVPAYDIGRAEPYLFDSYEAKKSVKTGGNATEDYAMGDIAMATSAAPTYFPPVEIHDFGVLRTKHAYVDGSIVANNPSLYALMTAQRLFPMANEFLIVSLGCGNGPAFRIEKKSLQDYGVLGWGSYIIPTLMEASIKYTVRLLSTANEANFLPMSVDFKPLSPTGLDKKTADNMDLTEESDIQSITDIAGAYLGREDTRATIRLIKQILDEPRDYATGLGGKILDPSNGDLGPPGAK